MLTVNIRGQGFERVMEVRDVIATAQNSRQEIDTVNLIFSDGSETLDSTHNVTVFVMNSSGKTVAAYPLKSDAVGGGPDWLRPGF